MSDNLAIWNALSRTDPAHTKPFKRAGGFSGTALKPIWVDRLLTETFGPMGHGWGTDEPVFQLVPAGTDILVYCTVRGWYSHGGTKGEVYGVGGDKVLSTNKYGPVTDDEAFKKAFTDAKLNAFKSVGVGADIHMGLFDDTKYVAETRKEFSGAGGGAGQSLHAQVDPPAADKLQEAVSQPHKTQLKGPHKSKSALWKAVKAFDHELRGCGDIDQFEAFLAMDENKALLAQVQDEAPQLWHGDPSLPEEFEPLGALIAKMRTDLEANSTPVPIKGAEYLNAA